MESEIITLIRAAKVCSLAQRINSNRFFHHYLAAIGMYYIVDHMCRQLLIHHSILSV